MKIELKLERAKEVKSKFQRLKKDAQDTVVIVGYTAKYAIWVHEMVNAVFKAAGTGAKFLEAPARRFMPTLVKIVKQANNLKEGILTAGFRLQRESQKVCPVDTGNLRNSAFTREEF